MAPSIVLFVYAIAFALAAFLLYWFGHAQWYWHGLAVAVSMVLGLMPPLARGPVYDMMVGSLFLLAFIWGAGGAFVQEGHRPHIHHHA